MIEIINYPYDLGMASGYRQAQEGQRRFRIGRKVSQHVGLQMMYFNQRQLSTQREGLGKGYTDNQGANQSGASGEGNSIYLGGGDPGALKGRLHRRYDVYLMGTARMLGDYAAKLLVDGLASHDITQYVTLPNDGCRRIVAGRFNGENSRQ